MNEDQVLSEYIDGELPPDLAQRVKQRLVEDLGFRARYEALLNLQTVLKGNVVDQAIIADMQAHVWQRTQRRVGKRRQPWQQWLEAVSEALHRRIALPLPALAAMLVVVLTLGIVALARNSTGETSAVAANTNSNSSIKESSANTLSQSLVSFPSGLGTKSLVYSRLASAGLGLATTDSSEYENNMEVTIQVQNLRQLLALLEHNQDINQVTIQRPRLQAFQPYGKAIMLRASDLGIKPAMAVGVRASELK